GGLKLQQDQAVSRLGEAWHAIRCATAEYHRQAIQCAANSREGSIKQSVGDKQINLELSDIKGNVLCFPQEDENFPETWTQIQSRFMAILEQSTNNPFLMSLFQLPKNAKIAKDAIGLKDFDIPAAQSHDKQAGELDLLLKAEPQANPMIQQAKEALEAMVAK